VYYAYAGSRPRPEWNKKQGEEAMAALVAYGYIPSSSPVPPYYLSVYGVDFWDDAGEPQRTMIRESMQSDGISFSTVDCRGGGFIHAISAQTEDLWTPALLFVLRIGADPNMRDNMGQTPLHHAASHGNAKGVELLLLAGADPLAVDNNGWTVAHSAAMGSGVEVVIRLVDLGADISALTLEGESALHIAVEKSKEPRAMIQYLVDEGLRLDARSKAGFSPGYLSIWGPIESLAICLELGQDPFTHDDAMGNTMLLVGVYAMLPREVGLCLLKLSECP